MVSPDTKPEGRPCLALAGEVSRGFEPRSLDSESRVLTVTPRGKLSGFGVGAFGGCGVSGGYATVCVTGEYARVGAPGECAKVCVCGEYARVGVSRDTPGLAYLWNTPRLAYLGGTPWLAYLGNTGGLAYRRDTPGLAYMGQRIMPRRTITASGRCSDMRACKHFCM